MSVDRVRRWRDRLLAVDPAPTGGLLSAAGLRVVWREALEALGDEALATVGALPGEPWATAAMAVPSTVPTAPIEWCGVLLARGTAVTLKPPAVHPGLVPLLVEAARAEGLPLALDADRSALLHAELAIVQGGDDTVAAVAAARGGRPTLGFGHRFSVAWIREVRSLRGVAEDAARFDGRGCMSPTAVFTDLPLDEALPALADALAEMERRLPRGALLPEEGAALREHRARACAVGRVAEGPGWAALATAPRAEEPVGLVRAIHLHAVADRSAFRSWAERHLGRLSTVGTDDPLELPGVRICAPGDMQRPPLLRLHDGVDWVTRAARR